MRIQDLNRFTLKNRPKISKLFLQVIKDLVTIVIPALLIALLINVVFAEAALVEDGPSMQPNLFRGDRVMIEKLSYRLHQPQRGDIIVVNRPSGEVALIKRVVALPGETIEVRDGHTYVNGELLDEPWVTSFGGPDFPLKIIPKDHVFIMGDNRGNSHDSRVIGSVPIESIKGRVWLVFWPFSDLKWNP